LHLQGGILCHTSSPFCSGYFGGGGGVLWTICPGWPWKVILPMSASHVARLTSLSHWCPALALLIFVTNNIISLSLHLSILPQPMLALNSPSSCFSLWVHELQSCPTTPRWHHCFFFEVLGLELRAYTLNHSTNPFRNGFFSR
jgi:hypothetical protein